MRNRNLQLLKEGNKFNLLTLISFSYKGANGNDFWNCICECGNYVTADSHSLIYNNTKSCGCIWVNKSKSLEGLKFGRLTVLRFSGYDKWNNSIFLCQCECGNTTTVRGSSLKRKDVSSCGCLSVEAGKKTINKNRLIKIDITGNRYNQWLVLKETDNWSANIRKWLCVCDCGREVEVAKIHLISGLSKSCGHASFNSYWPEKNLKWCNGCEKWLTLDQHFNSNKGLGYTYCHTCRPYKASFYEFKRRALVNQAEGFCSDHELKQLVEFYGGICQICFNEADSIDHVIPLFKGGSNWIENLCPLCGICNSSKGSKLVKDYRKLFPSKELIYQWRMESGHYSQEEASVLYNSGSCEVDTI